MSSVCDCDAGTYESTLTHEVDGDSFTAALGSDGTLTAEGCAALCRDDLVDVVEVLGCSDLGEIPPRGSATTGTGAGGGGAGVGGNGVGGGVGGGGAGGGAGGAAPTPAPAHAISCAVVRQAYCEGRRHAGVEGDLDGHGPSEAAAWLARAAAAEAASVASFVTLRDELRALRAPTALVDGARRAAADEVRHARLMGELARSAGAAAPAAARRVELSPRTLFEVALENAVEGCVHETFAALMAMHQRQHARDADVERTMATIADDEVGHAELAWAIHRWACTRLSPDEVERLRSAMREAAAHLADELATSEIGEETRRALGIPAPARAAALAQAATRHLWS